MSGKRGTKKKKKAKRKARKKKPEAPYLRISWDDLEDWAGSRIVSRGKDYHRRGAVRDLACAADGALVAWVFGSARYATLVTLDESGALSSECSCPYWDTCKHAVAVLLAYLGQLKDDRDIPALEDGDTRLEELERRRRYLEDPDDELDEDDWQYWDDESDDDDLDDDDELEDGDEEAAGLEPPSSQGAPSSRRASLQRLTKAELIALIEEAGTRYPEVWSLVDHRQAITGGKTGKILQAVRTAIQDLHVPAWDHEWDDCVDADLERLKEHLEALLNAGHADSLVQLGPELLEAAGYRLESEHEGESAIELGECMEVVFSAVYHSTLAEAAQIEWIIDMDLADGYDLCGAGLEGFWDKMFSQEAWESVAGRLDRRLQGPQEPSDTDSYGQRHRRDQLVDWIVTACENAGIEERIIPLCEREAPVTGSYERLVNHLVTAERLEEAERWCRQGILDTESSRPGLAANLRKTMQTIAGQQGDPLRVVALKASEFFNSPSLKAFHELIDASRESRVEEAVDAWARSFLVTGQPPPGVAGRSRRRRKSDLEVAWSLPDPGVPLPACDRRPSAPMTDILIRLAVEEQRLEDVLTWYDLHGSTGAPGWYADLDMEVAEAVAGTHPDRAVAIYKKKAEGLIATVTPRGYEAAGTYLRKIKRVLSDCGRGDEWSSYLETLRQANRRRPRCMEVLGRVDRGDRPIVNG